jgi:hypothetical protein
MNRIVESVFVFVIESSRVSLPSDTICLCQQPPTDGLAKGIRADIFRLVIQQKVL